jgi:hypothetical protein
MRKAEVATNARKILTCPGMHLDVGMFRMLDGLMFNRELMSPDWVRPIC